MNVDKSHSFVLTLDTPGLLLANNNNPCGVAFGIDLTATQQIYSTLSSTDCQVTTTTINDNLYLQSVTMTNVCSTASNCQVNSKLLLRLSATNCLYKTTSPIGNLIVSIQKSST